VRLLKSLNIRLTESALFEKLVDDS
jgi:hypothetical protein